MFIPANVLEAEVTSVPTGVDEWAAKAQTLDATKKYFLYNIEARKFYTGDPLGLLSAEPQDAVLCTPDASAKTISFVNSSAQINYVAASTAGISPSEYELEWTETSSGSKQYFLSQRVTTPSISDYRIHLYANKLYSGLDGAAIKTGYHPGDANGKFRWIFVEPEQVAYYSASAAYCSATSALEPDGTVTISANGASSETSDAPTLEGAQSSISNVVTLNISYTAAPKVITLDHGYKQEGKFIGWKTSPEAVGYVSTSATYVKSIEITCDATSAENRYEIPMLYAEFEHVNAFDAKLLDYRDNLIKINGEDGGSLAAVLAEANKAANANSTIVLMRDVKLTSAVTISNSVTLDFNNYTISGNIATALIVSASSKIVRLIDNSPEGTGGINLKWASYNNNADFIDAVKVTAGTLEINGGTIHAENTAAAKTGRVAGVTMTGGALTMNGGKIEAINAAATNAYGTCGIKVNGAKASVTLVAGTINATAATGKNYATGLYLKGTNASNKATATITWDAKINVMAASYAYGAYVYSYATLNMDGGVITAQSYSNGTYINGVYHYNATTTTNISGNAEIIATSNTTTTTNGARCYAVNANNSGCTISGGFIKSTGTTATYDVYFYGTAATKPSGGYFAHDKVRVSTSDKTLSGANGFVASNAAYEAVPAGAIKDRGYNHHVFVPGEVENAVATVNNKGFASLEDAIAYANNNADEASLIIRLQVPTYTLAAGTYTIPANTTLIIPYSRLHTTAQVSCPRLNDNSVPQKAFCALTLAPNTHIDVFGTIEIGGRQNSYATSGGGTGRPNSDYGQLIMGENCEIVLNNGSRFRAWGFVTGATTSKIDVRRGARVDEMFQVYDFKGGNGTLNMCHEAAEFGRPVNNHKAFPVTQYHIQNIEIPTIYRPGSALYGSMAAVDQGVAVKVIGTNNDVAAIFFMNNEDDSEDTWVQKWYNPSSDQQVYDINNSAAINNLVMNFGYYTFNSQNYTLPITNNMKIHLLSGEMHITQNTTFLPGVELEINKLSTMTVDEDVNLYMHDSEQWGAYSFKDAYASKIKYRPGGVPGSSVRDISSAAALGDAQINVHGTVAVVGAIRTTDGGANIFSTNADAGTVTFAEHCSTTDEHTFDTWTHQTGSGSETEPHYIDYHAASAKLKNGNGAFTSTVGATEGMSYCYINNQWVNMTDEDCFAYDQYGVYYIKPQAYVPISVGVPSEEADHTYRDHYAGTNGIYILTSDIAGNCQWWEVEPVAGHPDLFRCLHPKNDDVYYYYNTTAGVWEEKKFVVKWQNWDGSLIEDYKVKYNTMPKYLGSTPSREKTDYYTYDFAGWSPDLTSVTEDVTYLAKFTQTDRKYIITFKDASNNVIETQYLKMNDIPACSDANYPGANKTWNPAISAVTGDATYIVASIPAGPYNIKFVNWNGTVLKKANGTDDAIYSVASGNQPSYDGAEPEKPALTDEIYTFNGWIAADGAVYDNDHLPNASAPAIYTASFAVSKSTYTIKFVKENGDPETPADVLSVQTEVAYGAMPNIPEYSKESPAAYTDYTLVWSPLVSAATQNQVYTATFTSKPQTFKVEWKDGDNNIIETKYFDQSATPTYSGVTPTKSLDETNAYTFNGKWFLNDATESSADFTVINGANQVYTADFDAIQRSIEANNGETEIINTSVTVKEITIHTGGIVKATPGATITTDVLVLEASTTASGQLDAAMINATNAYFEWSMNGAAGTQRRTWYAIAVPWEVNAESGIFWKEGNRQLILGRDFDLVWYDGAERAARGDSYACWKYVEEETDKIMHPGKMYMMYFGPEGIKTVRFTKASGAQVIYTSPINVEVYPEQTDNEGKDGNWNGIANPRTYYASLETGASFAQILGNGNLDDAQANPKNVYTTIDVDASKFIVGQPLYVQAVSAQPVVVNKATSAGIVLSAAPRRAKAHNLPDNILTRFALHIAAEGKANADNLFIQATEDAKEDKYVIGQDLVKGGVAKSIPQLWVNRYNSVLSVNTQTLIGNVAEYPLSIYAPQDGDYVINTDNADDEYALYLTQDGQVIWNLGYAPYTITMDKGVSTAYGLRIMKKSPEVTTGVEEAIFDAHGETRKVLINNHVFIIRGDNMYSIDGQMVK